MTLHRTVTDDGREIVGRVAGQGPALVLVHGGIGDGDIAWPELLPHLTDRFTCYLPSTRGRGLSSDDPDHSPPRLQEDVVAFVESIGEPVCLVGWSGSGSWVLGAAAECPSVRAVAIHEPGIPPTMSEEERGRTFATFERMGMAAAEGRLADAARAFIPWICNDEETATLDDPAFHESWGAAVPAMLRFIQGDAAYAGPRSTDPEALARVAVPVLLLRGEQTRLAAWFADSAAHLAAYLPDVAVRQVPGVGHFAPVVAPEVLAGELVSFFESVGQPAQAR